MSYTSNDFINSSDMWTKIDLSGSRIYYIKEGDQKLQGIYLVPSQIVSYHCPYPETHKNIWKISHLIISVKHQNKKVMIAYENFLFTNILQCFLLFFCNNIWQKQNVLGITMNWIYHMLINYGKF